MTKYDPLAPIARQEPITGAALKVLIGRPPDYDPSYCQLVLSDCAAGYSFGGFAGRIGVARSTITDWSNRYPEFAAACARAQSGRLRFWESKAIDIATTGGAGGGQVQIVLAGLYNAGREDWQNKQTIEHSGQISLASIVQASMQAIEARVIEHEPSAPSAPSAPAKTAEIRQSEPSHAPSAGELQAVEDLF